MADKKAKITLVVVRSRKCGTREISSNDLPRVIYKVKIILI